MTPPPSGPSPDLLQALLALPDGTAKSTITDAFSDSSAMLAGLPDPVTVTAVDAFFVAIGETRGSITRALAESGGPAPTFTRPSSYNITFVEIGVMTTEPTAGTAIQSSTLHAMYTPSPPHTIDVVGSAETLSGVEKPSEATPAGGYPFVYMIVENTLNMTASYEHANGTTYVSTAADGGVTTGISADAFTDTINDLGEEGFSASISWNASPRSSNC